MAEGLAIQYALVRPATGTLRTVRESSQIELFATLVATLQGSSETPPAFFELRFTTGTAQASNASRTETVTVDGTPAEAENYVQLVGAATNRADAFPGPGEAVYAICAALCYDSAINRKGACEQGLPPSDWPPLITWNN